MNHKRNSLRNWLVKRVNELNPESPFHDAIGEKLKAISQDNQRIGEMTTETRSFIHYSLPQDQSLQPYTITCPHCQKACAICGNRLYVDLVFDLYDIVVEEGRKVSCPYSEKEHPKSCESCRRRDAEIF